MKFEIELPDPPEGFVACPGRLPKAGEKHYAWHPGLSEWEEYHGPSGEDDYYILAFSPPKKKRLLRPEELAGKWLIWDDSCRERSFIGSFSSTNIWVHNASKGKTVEECFKEGCTYSDTPTSERKPLEVEE